MPSEPSVKRAIAFIDGQNLFHAAKTAFGHPYPNYAPRKLAEAVCREQGWALTAVQFYTGIPDAGDNAFWHEFWTRKRAVMGTRNIQTFTRKLRYRNQAIRLLDGSETTVLVGQEKGIDARLALDVVRLGREKRFDVALVFSQDQDLPEVAREIRSIARDRGRWIKMASAYPVSPTTRNGRGVERTDWIQIDRATYAACIDPIDYRSPQ